MPRNSKKLVESLVHAIPVADTSAPDQTAMNTAASAPANDDRDAQRRDLPGNAGGSRNPQDGHCARMLGLFRKIITDEKMEALFRVLFERASTGDVAALKLIWQYKLGKPLRAPNPATVDREG
ncbi:hypothetical protein BH10PLA2_BH10PLA2_16200 [soil metagenome]